MATMNISLPDTLREFVESRVTEGGYSTASEYFRELVREDQKQKAHARLEELLLEGLASGSATDITPEFWRKLRADIADRRAIDANG